MRSAKIIVFPVVFLVCLTLLCSSSLFAKTRSTSKVSSPAPRRSGKLKRASAQSSRKKRTKKGDWKRHGQQNIANDRTRQIQSALIDAKYLQGEPTGAMDSRTKEALSRYQADNGWQSKIVPDARALIKLGLGPAQGKLLNPNTAVLPSVAVKQPETNAAAGSPQR